MQMGAHHQVPRLLALERLSSPSCLVGTRQHVISAACNVLRLFNNDAAACWPVAFMMMCAWHWRWHARNSLEAARPDLAAQHPTRQAEEHERQLREGAGCTCQASAGWMPAAACSQHERDADHRKLTLAPKNVILKKSSLTCGMPASPLNGAGLRSIAAQRLAVTAGAGVQTGVTRSCQEVAVTNLLRETGPHHAMRGDTTASDPVSRCPGSRCPVQLGNGLLPSSESLL